MQLEEALDCERARYLHRTVPTAVLGGLIVVGLIVAVFQAVVPGTYLLTWLAIFILMSAARMLYWVRYKRLGLDLENSRRWLTHAARWALVSGVVWDSARCSSFPMARSSTSTPSCSRW